MLSCDADIVDCSGKKIKTGQSGQLYSQRCAYGNLEDYVKDHQAYNIPEISNPENVAEKPASINIVIPIYNTGEKVLETVKAVLSSNFTEDQKVELCFIVNGPKNMSKEAVRQNQKTTELLNYIFKRGEAPTGENPAKFEAVKNLFEQKAENFKVIITPEIKSTYGLSEIYQKAVSSYLSRTWNYIKQSNKEKPELIKMIEEVNDNSTLLFLDDDIILQKNDLEQMHQACVNSGIAVGEMKVISVELANKELTEVLKTVMQSWLNFKRAFNLNTLSPRMTTLEAFHHAEDVPLGKPYADQQFFAKMRAGRNVYKTEVATSIAERDFPCNGGFMKQLRLYFEGKITSFAELEFLNNVLNIYQKRGDNDKYTLAEVAKFVDLIKDRKIDEILEMGKNLQEKIIFPHEEIVVCTKMDKCKIS